MSKLPKVLNRVKAGLHAASRVCCWIAGSCLVVLVLVVAIDVIGRKFGHPVEGSTDIEAMLLIPIAFLAMAFTQLEKGHVRIELLYSRVSTRLQGIFDTFTRFLSVIIYALIAYAMVDRVVGIIANPTYGPVTPGLRVPIYPLLIVVAIGRLLLSLEILIDLSHSLVQALGKKSSDFRYEES